MQQRHGVTVFQAGEALGEPADGRSGVPHPQLRTGPGPPTAPRRQRVRIAAAVMDDAQRPLFCKGGVLAAGRRVDQGVHEVEGDRVPPLAVVWVRVERLALVASRRPAASAASPAVLQGS